MRRLTRHVPTHGPRSRRHPRRGFTLLEVVVVAVVASLIFLILTRWVLTLGTVSSVTLEHTTAARAATYADFRLAGDLASATTCGPQAGNPIRELTDQTLELYLQGTDAAGTATTYLARWQVSGPNLTRTLIQVDPATGRCDATGTSFGERVIASAVRTPTPDRPAFTATVDGTVADGCQIQEVTDAAGFTREASVGAGCFAAAVTVNLVMLSGGTEQAPVTLDRTYQVNSNGRGL